jgi:hypothetical protein
LSGQNKNLVVNLQEDETMRTVFAIALATAAMAVLTPARAQNTVLVICANEGQTCIAPNANTSISYGKNGAVKTISGVTSIGCDNGSFQGDPLVGQGKYCTYTIIPGNLTWTQCAQENDSCGFTGAKLVRYGAGNSWVYGSFVNGVGCNNGTFGDPAYGTSKSCFVAN